MFWKSRASFYASGARCLKELGFRKEGSGLRGLLHRLGWVYGFLFVESGGGSSQLLDRSLQRAEGTTKLGMDSEMRELRGVRVAALSQQLSSVSAVRSRSAFYVVCSRRACKVLHVRAGSLNVPGLGHACVRPCL